MTKEDSDTKTDCSQEDVNGFVLDMVRVALEDAWRSLWPGTEPPPNTYRMACRVRDFALAHGPIRLPTSRTRTRKLPIGFADD